MPPPSDSVSDPTDWLAAPCIGSVSAIDAGLRCEICKDFYTAPVITHCCHTFCSGCIRRTSSAVNASRKCPVCWQSFDEGQLRKNKVVEDLVKSFLAAREELLQLGQWYEDSQTATEEVVMERLEYNRKRKRTRVAGNNDMVLPEPSPRKTRSQRQQETQPGRDFVESDMAIEQEEQQQQQQQDNVSQIDDGKVACPICQQRMPIAEVYPHLEVHTDNKPVVDKPPIKLPNRTQPPVPAMTPLPTLSYTLLNDIQLRKKLRELGIPSDGNKLAMSRRHTEWRNLVNANCDSSNPKSKSELLRELNQWERTLRSSENTNAQQHSRSNVMDKDFDGGAWSTNHNSEFQNLIAAARAATKPRAVVEATNPAGNQSMQDEVQPISHAEPIGLDPEQSHRISGFDVP